MVTALVNFPSFALGIFLGLFKAVLTEIESFLLLVFGVLLGVTTEPLIGVTVAFGLYVTFRMFGQYVVAIVSSKK